MYALHVIEVKVRKQEISNYEFKNITVLHLASSLSNQYTVRYFY